MLIIKVLQLTDSILKERSLFSKLVLIQPSCFGKNLQDWGWASLSDSDYKTNNYDDYSGGAA